MLLRVGICFVAVFCVGFGLLLNPASALAQGTEVLVVAQVDVADQTEKAQKKVKKKKKKEKRECRRVRETGSRIASRVCKKPSEWAQRDKTTRDTVERSIEGARRNTGTVNSQ